MFYSWISSPLQLIKRIGSILGFFTNFYQETLYQFVFSHKCKLEEDDQLLTFFWYRRRYFPTRGPEARLYLVCFAAVMLPIGMFIYAWSSFVFVNWISLTIGITLFIWATFIMYLAAFSYLADWCEFTHSLHVSDLTCFDFFSFFLWISSYGPFASSALAGQSLASNLFIFPNPEYRNLIHRLT